MKIKVGDWVKVEDKIGKVAHVYSPSSEWVAVKLDGVGIIDVRINTVTKLPIKFKGFEVKQECYGSWGFADGVSEHRKIIQGDSHAKFFTEAVDETMKLFIGHVGKPYAIKSDPMPIIQARDWLELQYATMLAKARGLV